jgi:hypothetical protein
VRSMGSQDGNSPVQRVFWQYKLAGPATHTITALLEDWAAVATLYDLVLTFAEDYNGEGLWEGCMGAALRVLRSDWSMPR